MKYVLSATQMKQIDQNTSDFIGILSLVLMERAALSVADEVSLKFDKNQSIAIFCGTGNNGADGLAIGRILNERGYHVHFFMSKNAKKYSKANQTQQDILSALDIEIDTNFPKEEYDIIIDALFGIGLSRKIEADYAKLIDFINASDSYKIAVDIPSGIDTDYGEILGTAVKADETITFAYYKYGLLLYPGREYCGKIKIADIGIHDKSFLGMIPNGFTFDDHHYQTYLPKRMADSHKGTYHKAALIAGSKEIGGALILSAMSCMRTGIGYLKVFSDISNRDSLLSYIPEALMYFDKNSLKELNDCTCIGIGPGLTVSDWAYELLKNVLEFSLSFHEKRFIFDADALNLIAMHNDIKDLFLEIAKNNDVVITPHKKEFSRLASIDMSASKKEFIAHAKTLSKEWNITIVLKSAATLCFSKDGKVYVNQSGNDGLAKAGSGDVLTGILTGFGAQLFEHSIFEIAAFSVYVHGLCADYIKSDSNSYAMVASDVSKALHEVLKGEKENETL